VRDEDDDVVPVTSSVSGFTYHSTSDSWEFDSPGSMALEWSTTADFGDTIDFDTEEPGVTFSGTLHQSVGMSLPAPDVTQAECSEDAAVVGPRVTHDENEHIVEFVYHANDAPVDDLSEVGPGDAVVITAWPEEGVQLVAGNGWEVGSDGELIYSVALDEAPDCVETPDEEEPAPPAGGDSPDGDPTPPADSSDSADPSGTTPGEDLPETGADVEASLAAGAVLILAGVAALLVRRRA